MNFICFQTFSFENVFITCYILSHDGEGVEERREEEGERERIIIINMFPASHEGEGEEEGERDRLHIYSYIFLKPERDGATLE